MSFELKMMEEEGEPMSSCPGEFPCPHACTPSDGDAMEHRQPVPSPPGVGVTPASSTSIILSAKNVPVRSVARLTHAHAHASRILRRYHVNVFE